MSDLVKAPGMEIAREGKLTLSPVAQRLQQVGHEILNGAGLTLVAPETYSTCPEPIEEFTDRLLRARDRGIPLIEVELVGPDLGYERVNRQFGIDGRTIDEVRYASGVEQLNEEGVTSLEHQAVSLAMFRADEMLRLSDQDKRISTHAGFGKFEGYDGGLTDLWGLPKEAMTGAYYKSEYGNIMCPPDAKPMHRILDQVMLDLPRVLFAEGAIDGTATDIADQPQLARGVAGYLD